MALSYLLKLSKVCFWLAGGFWGLIVAAFLLFAPLEIVVLEQKISFTSLVNPFKISAFLVLLGALLKYFYNHKGIKGGLDGIKNGFRPQKILNFITNLPRGADWFLLLILCLGGWVRFWGISFGLPHLECRPDEETIVGIAFNFFSGDYHPQFFNYPTLYMYLLHGLYYLYFVTAKFVGVYKTDLDLDLERYLDPSNFFLADRYLAALLGTATIIWVYKIAKYFFDKRTALLASLFFSLAYLHVRDSHFGVTDTPQLFFIMGAVYYIIKSLGRTNGMNYALAGIWAGMATAVKYSGIFLTASVGIVHFLNFLKGKKGSIDFVFIKPILWFCGMFFLALFLGSPHIFLNFNKFITDFLKEVNHLGSGHTIDLGIGWWYHLRFSLFHGLGWGLFFASLAGLLFLFKTDFQKALVLCSFPLIYYGVSGSGNTVFVRYALPLVPFFCITAALWANKAYETVVRRFSPLTGNLALLLLVGVIAGPSMYKVLQFDTLLAQRDNRLIVSQWIYNHIPEGASVFQTGSIYGKLPVEYPLIELESQYENTRDEREKLFIRKKIDFMKKNNIRGFQDYKYKEEKNLFYYRDIKKNLPDFIFVEKSPLILYSRVPENIASLCRKEYTLIKSFEAVDLKTGNNLYDQQDAFYLPLAGFSNIKKPGPNVYVYQKNIKD